MKKLYFIFFTFSFLTGNFLINAQRISEFAEISIITCAPGNELYSTFGHTAVRVKDLMYKIDNVYNYGTFDFETSNFYMKFTRGKLDYMLSVSHYKYFVISYMNENRWISEQVLNLSFDKKKIIFKFLENNALPENKYYRYDFFYDNCATRVKDVIKNILAEDLIYAESVTKQGDTFRDILIPYLKGKDWERLGINLALGQPANKIVSVDEASFLPDYTELIFDKSFIILNDEKIPLVKDKRMLFEPKSVSENSRTLLTPSLLFWSIFILYVIITFLEIKKENYFVTADKTLFFITGFAGFILLFLWIATDHTAVVNNLDIIWTMPLYLYIAFALRKKENLFYIRIFLLLWAIILFISLVTDLTFYNLYDNAVIPIVLILLFRSTLVFFFRKQ